jgi:hypothetical protein
MYPDADVPVVQLSLDRGRPDRWHYEAGKRLAALRDEGVLIMGSGDIVHNLRAADFRRPEAPAWADRFNEAAKALILAGDHDPLIDWRSPGSRRGDLDQQRRALSAVALCAGRAGGRRGGELLHRRGVRGDLDDRREGRLAAAQQSSLLSLWEERRSENPDLLHITSAAAFAAATRSSIPLP